MKKYAIYAIDQTTDELDVMIAKYPNAAEYLPFYLFCQTYEDLTGEPHSNQLDLSHITLTDSPELPTDKTFAEFDAMADSLIAGGFEGREVVLSVQQGRYLKQTRYPNDEEVL